MTFKYTYIRTIHNIEEYKLENGLICLLIQDLTQSTITVNLTLNVGSRHEGPGEAGIAHLLEHMLFKGTKKFPNSKDILQQKGAVFNATTWYDRTNYYETLSSSFENLKFAIEFEADRMVNALITDNDLKSEVTVVLNEFEINENDSISVLHDEILSAAFRWHNYGRATIGNLSNIKNASSVQVKAFYKKFYHPNNATLIISGNFNKDDAILLVTDFFGKIPFNKNISSVLQTIEPVQSGSRLIKVSRSGDMSAVGVLYHIPSVHHPDFAPLKILGELISYEPGGLLYNNFVLKEIASEMFGVTYQLAEAGLILIFLKPVFPERIFFLKAELIKILESISEFAISKIMIERAKAKLFKNFKLIKNDSKKITLALTESISQGDYSLFFSAQDQLNSVSLADVKRVAGQYLISTNRTAGIFIPSDNIKLAQTGDLPKLKITQSKYESCPEIAINNSFTATLQNINANLKNVILNNGVPVSLLYKKTCADIVRCQFIFSYGTSEDSKQFFELMNLLPKILGTKTKTKTNEVLHDQINCLESGLKIYSDFISSQIIVDLKSNKENIVNLITLFMEIISEPIFSKSEFSVIQKKEISEHEECLYDPKVLALNEVQKEQNKWNQNSIHYISSLQERIDILKTLTISKFSNAYLNFYNQNRLNISVVGSFDFEKFLFRLNNSLSKWKSNNNLIQVKKPYAVVVSGTKILKVPNKQVAAVALGTTLKLQDLFDDYPAFRLGAYMLGEGTNSRIWNTLRELNGLSYTAGSFVDISDNGGNSTLTLYALAGLQNAKKAHNLLLKELGLWLNNSITEKELLDSLVGYKLMFDNLLSNDQFIISLLSSNLICNRSLNFQINFFEKIKKLTPQNVARAINKYISLNNVFSVMAGDF